MRETKSRSIAILLIIALMITTTVNFGEVSASTSNNTIERIFIASYDDTIVLREGQKITSSLIKKMNVVLRGQTVGEEIVNLPAKVKEKGSFIHSKNGKTELTFFSGKATKKLTLPVKIKAKKLQVKLKKNALLREGQVLQKLDIDKAINYSSCLYTDGKIKENFLGYQIKQLGKVVKSDSKGKFKVKLYLEKTQKVLHLNVDSIKRIYIGESTYKLISGACVSQNEFKQQTNVYAVYKSGITKKLSTYSVTTNGNIVNVKYGKFNDTIILPTVAPTATPTVEPTATPTVVPTATPTVEPTATPTIEPTATPTVAPTVEPTATPTVAPTATPTVEPTATPTIEQTATPTVAPTVEPTATPTVAPTATPTVEPTATPTVAPTATPTVVPTATPTVAPTATPTIAPTATPTVAPTATPTVEPTATPTVAPTATPTVKPEVRNTISIDDGTVWDKLLEVITFGIYKPDTVVTINSSLGSNAEICYYVDTTGSTKALSVEELSSVEWQRYDNSFELEKTTNVVYARIVDFSDNEIYYICSEGLDLTPTATPIPTVAPTATPTVAPTATPTVAPTATPTVAPTATPTVAPTATPTVAPTATPTVAPTATPTVAPTATPTVAPTVAPTATPTIAPTATPTLEPTATPEPKFLNIKIEGEGQVYLNEEEIGNSIQLESGNYNLQVVPETGYEFVAIKDSEGNILSNKPNYNFDFTKNTSIIVEFVKIYTLSITKVGSGKVDINNSAGEFYGGIATMEFVSGKEVVLKAASTSTYRFVRWTNSNGTELSTNKELSLTMDSDISVIAVFEKIYTLTITREGLGTVELDDELLKFTNNLSEKVLVPGLYKLKAISTDDYNFVNWTDESGNVLSTNPEYTISLTSDKQIIVNFAEAEKTVVVTYKHENGQLLKSDSVEFGQTLAPPTTDLWKAEKTFVGWRLNDVLYSGETTAEEFYDENNNSLTEAIRTLTSKKENVEIFASYVANPVKTYSVEVSGGAITVATGGAITVTENGAEVEAGTYIEVSNSVPEGYVFNYWTDKDGNILSYFSKYSCFVQGDMKIIAVYSEEVVEPEPVVAFTGNKYDIFVDESAIQLKINSKIPNNYDKLEWGLLLTTKLADEDIVIGSSLTKLTDTLEDTRTARNATLTVNAKLPSATFANHKLVKARVYAIVQNSMGTKEIYSEVIHIQL